MDKVYNKYRADGYIKGHINRFKRTVNYIRPFIKDNMNILNVGGEGTIINELLNTFSKNVSVENTDCDIRYDFITKRDKYDLIISLEVIEHLKDRDTSYIPTLATQVNSGIWNFFLNCNRLLDVDGLFFVTTPNMNSYLSMLNLINYKNPNFFTPHPKEISKNEIFHFNKVCNFSIIKYDTFNVWNKRAEDDEVIKQIHNLFMSIDANLTHHRGEDMFFISKKLKNIENKILNVASGLKRNILKSNSQKLITIIDGVVVHEKL
jgi:SAM-dependent methyltransferase